MARAQTMWKEWRQDLMWQPSVAPLRLQDLHLIMRPRRPASSTFSNPPDSLTHTYAAMHDISNHHKLIHAKSPRLARLKGQNRLQLPRELAHAIAEVTHSIDCCNERR